MSFLQNLQGRLEFDLYGRGFQYIEDKWDALAAYRYSLAIENFRNPYYWSEKLVDCFLSWTMPIYYGCTRIAEFFPREAMVCIDIHDPQAPDKIQEAISGDLWHRNLDAIAEARRLALEKYQLFPFVTEQIQQHERSDQVSNAHTSQVIDLTRQLRAPLTVRMWSRIKHLAPISVRLKIRDLLER